MSTKRLCVFDQSASVDSNQLYTVDLNTLTRVTNGIGNGAISAGRYAAHITPDGTYLATSGAVFSGTCLKMYKWDEATTKYNAISAPQVGIGMNYVCKWSNSSGLLLLCGNTSPYIQIVERIGESFTLLTAGVDYPAMPSAPFVGAWITENLFVLGFNNGTTPVIFYRRVDATSPFVAVSASTLLSTGLLSYPAMAIAASADGKFLSIGFSSGTTTSVRFWSIDPDTDVGTYLGAPAIPTGFSATGMAFWPGADYLVANDSSFLRLFKRSGNVFAHVSQFSGITFRSCAVSGDGLHFSGTGYSGGSTGYTMVFSLINDVSAHITTLSGGQVFSTVAEWFPNISANNVKPISGHVFDQNGAPISRIVRAYHRGSGNLISEAVSEPSTGAYEMQAYNRDEHYVLVLDDDKNAMIYDHITPVI